MTDPATNRDIIVKKEGAFLYFTRPDGQSVRFNLKENCMEGPPNKRLCDWHRVENQYKFFLNYSYNDIKCEDPKFKRLIKLVHDGHPRIASVSSFIKNLAVITPLEPFIDQNIRFEFRLKSDYYANDYTLVTLEHPAASYDRNVLRFFQQSGAELTTTFEDFYFAAAQRIENERYQWRTPVPSQSPITEVHNIATGRSLTQRFLAALALLALDGPSATKVINAVVGRQGVQLLAAGFDIADLARYIGRDTMNEGITPDDAVELLVDYTRLCEQMNLRNAKRYPKYLQSMHDIASYNRRKYAEHFDEVAFAQTVRVEYEWENKEYAVVCPTTSKHVKDEGNQLSHCVGSYVPAIIEGKKLILFMRNAWEKDVSLVTLEVIENKLCQAKGYGNRAITDNEKKFLRKWCKEKKLTYESSLLGKDEEMAVDVFHRQQMEIAQAIVEQEIEVQHE